MSRQTEPITSRFNNSIATSIHNELVRRLDNPLVRSFALTFAFLNWRIWVTLFSGDLAADARIEKIESLWGGTSFLCSQLPLMICAAILYVYVLPLMYDWFSVFPRFLEKGRARKDAEYQSDLEFISQSGRNLAEIATGFAKVAKQQNMLIGILETYLPYIPSNLPHGSYPVHDAFQFLGRVKAEYNRLAEVPITKEGDVSELMRALGYRMKLVDKTFLRKFSWRKNVK